MSKKVSELQGKDLDRWAAKSQKWTKTDQTFDDNHMVLQWVMDRGHIAVDDYTPSIDKAQAMELLIKLKLSVSYDGAHKEWRVDDGSITFELYGDTPMIAISRAAVASVYGEEVEGG